MESILSILPAGRGAKLFRAAMPERRRHAETKKGRIHLDGSGLFGFGVSPYCTMCQVPSGWRQATPLVGWLTPSTTTVVW